MRKSYTANHTNENIALNEIDNEKKEINKFFFLIYKIDAVLFAEY